MYYVMNDTPDSFSLVPRMSTQMIDSVICQRNFCMGDVTPLHHPTVGRDLNIIDNCKVKFVVLCNLSCFILTWMQMLMFHSY